MSILPSCAACTNSGPSRAARRGAPPHPRHEEEPGDHGVEAAALEGDLLGLAAALARLWQVARTAARSAAHERPRLPPAPIAGGPPVAREDRAVPFPGRARLAGQAGPVPAPSRDDDRRQLAAVRGQFTIRARRQTDAGIAPHHTDAIVDCRAPRGEDAPSAPRPAQQPSAAAADPRCFRRAVRPSTSFAALAAVRGPGRHPSSPPSPWSAGAGGGLQWTPYQRAARSDAFTRGLW